MSSLPTPPDLQGASTRPYLIRALHEWCTDHGFTPYLAVHVDASVLVPLEYVKNHEIVLNVGFDATQGLKLGNERIEFRARFGGVAREIAVPVDHVIAIYARENGQGMAFPMPTVGPAPESARGLAVVPDSKGSVTLRGPSDATRVAPSLRLASVDRPASDTLASVPPPAPPPAAPTAIAPVIPPAPDVPDPPAGPSSDPSDEPPTEPPPRDPDGGGRPALKRIK